MATDETAQGGADPSNRLTRITLDASLENTASADVAHERDVAVYDLIADNRFALAGATDGPFELHLAISENRLVLDITGARTAKAKIILSLNPFRRIIRDYFMVCESYYQAIRTAPPSRIEALDMGRRALHDEGSQVLLERLAGKIETDFATARRLFTLVCALHWRG